MVGQTSSASEHLDSVSERERPFAMLLLPYYAHLSVMGLTIVLLVLLAFRIYLRRTVFFKCEDRLDGKTVIITGSNSGVGQAAAIELAKRGAKVILACRDRSRRDSAPFAVRSRSGNVNVRFMYLDLANLDSVVEFVREFYEREDRLDVLINNAAIMSPKDHTQDGLDLVTGVNVLAHFLLTNLLLDKMTANRDGTRLINVVCDAYKSGKVEMGTVDLGLKDEDYSMYKAYASSKLLLVLLTKEMAKRYLKNGVSVFAVDPGSVASNIYRNWPGWMGKVIRNMGKLVFRTPEDGSQTILYCAMARHIEKDSGKFFYNCHYKDTDLHKYNEEFYQELWDKMETVLKSKNFGLSLIDYPDD